MGWIVTSFILTSAIFIVPFGRLADIYGRRKIFLIGLVSVTIASLFATFATSAGQLIIFRVIQGISSAMIFGTSVAILTSSYPPRDRGRVLGINVSAVYVGLAAGPFIGGIITNNLGWRYIFIFSVLLGIIGSLLALWKLTEEWEPAGKEKFDLTGSVIYAIMLLSLMYGLSLLPSINGGIFLLGGILGLVIFIWWESNNKSPVLNIRMFRTNLVFTMSNLAALINYSATFAISFLLSFYLQYIKGFDPQTAGLILIAQPLVQAILSPVAGKLSDKIEPGIVASSGMGLCAIGLIIFNFLTPDTSMIYVIVGLLIMGIGFALFSSPNTNAVMSSVEKRFYGVASGMLGTMRLTGQMMSLGIAMLIFSIFIGRVQITPEYFGALMSSIKAAFIVFAILCIIGIPLSLKRGNMRQDKPPMAAQNIKAQK
jgi:EmrB/QacA subfamily drug resistance transporter